MNTQEKRERIRIRRRQQVARQRMTLLLAIAMLIILGSIVCGTILSSAKDPATDLVQHKYYKSIVIEQGDSLWSIAEEYCLNGSMSKQAYVEELKQLNSLPSDTIHAGQYLVVAYFDTALYE